MCRLCVVSVKVLGTKVRGFRIRKVKYCGVYWEKQYSFVSNIFIPTHNKFEFSLLDTSIFFYPSLEVQYNYSLSSVRHFRCMTILSLIFYSWRPFPIWYLSRFSFIDSPRVPAHIPFLSTLHLIKFRCFDKT